MKKNIYVFLLCLLSISQSFGQTAPTCTPNTTTNCDGPPDFWFYLTSFNLNSVNGTSNPVCGGYSYNTNTFNTSNLTAGESYSYSVSGNFSPFMPPNPFKFAIWLDINNDGDFEDAGEELVQWTAMMMYSNTLTIPANTVSGLINMRVMIHNDMNATLTPCGTFSSAETEDYVVQIAGASCTPTISSNSPVQEDATIELTSSVADTYSWTGPNGFTSSSQNPSITNATGANAGIYTATITSGTCTATATTNVAVILPLF